MYARHTRSGRHYQTAEAKSFKDAIAILARGAVVDAERYELDASVFLGKAGRGDGDNFWKCIADGLVNAGVIRSDAAVKRWVLEVDRDWENPRTELTVRAYAGKRQ
jgi:crossover junction endodeoxyribonuclease RusA